MLNDALNLAKGNDGKKVGISVQITQSLKDDFEGICKNNDVSMASMLQALIQIAVNQSKGTYTKSLEDSQQEYKDKLIDKLFDEYSENLETLIHMRNGKNINGLPENMIGDEIDALISRNNEIKSEIKQIGGIK